MMRKVILLVLFISICVVLVGCGETIHGLGEDVGRMGRGINTFFFRQK